MSYNEGKLREGERQVDNEVRGWRQEHEGGDEQELNDRRGEGEREGEGGMLFIEGDKAWCLFPRGAQRLIFLFFLNQHFNLLSFARSLPPSLSPSLSQIGLLSACRPRREWASVAASSVPVCTPHWLCLLNTKCCVSSCTPILVRTTGVGCCHNVSFANTIAECQTINTHNGVSIFFFANLVNVILKKCIALMEQCFNIAIN